MEDLHHYELALLESDVCDKQVLGSMYEDAVRYNKEMAKSAKAIFKDYETKKANKYTTYKLLKQLLKQRYF